MAHENLCETQWTLKNARAFLQAEGFHGKLVGKLINLHLESKKEDFPHEFIEDAIESVVPSTWYTDDIDTHIELPMHLIFLGVTKTVGFV